MGWPVAKSSLRCHCCKIYYARNPNRGEAGRRRTLGLSLFTADEGAGKLVGLTSCRGGDVKSLVTATLLLLFGLNVVAQDSSKPKISPFFDRIDDGPAFFVECRNTTGETVSSAHVMWASSLRIDGKLLPNEVQAGFKTSFRISGLTYHGERSGAESLPFGSPNVRFCPPQSSGHAAGRAHRIVESRKA